MFLNFVILVSSCLHSIYHIRKKIDNYDNADNNHDHKLFTISKMFSALSRAVRTAVSKMKRNTLISKHSELEMLDDYAIMLVGC